ncbi:MULTISPECIES: hypothetical protein [Sorangium]|uniref:hypothetical protein n=1 Tax=Sorangium TaxID=39643 RepID=UPI0013ED4860|nr:MULTISPECIES: hypothetical protein [Sorangium]
MEHPLALVREERQPELIHRGLRAAPSRIERAPAALVPDRRREPLRRRQRRVDDPRRERLLPGNLALAAFEPERRAGPTGAPAL